MRHVLAALVAVALGAAPAAAQEFFRVEGSTAGLGEHACTPHSIPIGEMSGPWNIRFSLVSTPHTASLRLSAYDGTTGPFGGTASGWGGYLEVDAKLPKGRARNVSVCVGGEEATYTVRAHWTGGNERMVPTGSRWTSYDDELYRDLVFDNHEDPEGFAGATSRVLYNPIPQFYIRTSGPEGCGSPWRMHVETLHYWRAIIPILAEQLTGVPYRHRVEAWCDNRPDRRDWVTVHYTTAQEYEAETGREWGAAGARATLGASYGRIWIQREDKNLALNDWHRSLIAHEIGHAFGLLHTGQPGRVMEPNAGWDGKWPPVYPRGSVFTRDEEDSARRAYEVGRGARYCGDPMSCGRGILLGPEWFLNLPVIVVAD